AAHGFHAGNQLQKYTDNQIVQDYLSDGNVNGADFFNIAIAISVPEDAIKAIVNMSQKAGYVGDIVVDPTYPVGDGITVEMLTMGWVIGDRDDWNFRILVDGFDLA
ncbi:MAG: hypothetical protein WC284_12700, partial [Candidimonas sp.]